MSNMNTRQVAVKSGRVTTEGDDLYYEVRGQGQPQLMIAPAGGDEWQYSFVADILAQESCLQKIQPLVVLIVINRIWYHNLAY